MSQRSFHTSVHSHYAANDGNCYLGAALIKGGPLLVYLQHIFNFEIIYVMFTDAVGPQSVFLFIPSTETWELSA